MPSFPRITTSANYKVVACITVLWSIFSSIGLSGQLSIDNNNTLKLPKRGGREETSIPRKTDRLAVPRRAGAPEEDSSQPAVYQAHPGAWGDLQYFTVYLEASAALLKSMEFNSYDTTWTFVGSTEDDVTKLLKSVELSQPVRDELQDRTKWRHDGNKIIIKPSDNAVLSLSAEARATIYATLAHFEENQFHHEPEIVGGRDVRDWLRRAELPSEVLAAIEKTVYRRGKNLVFADTPLVMRMVQTEDERLKIRKALSRTPTLVVYLRLTAGTDVSKIAEYWGGPKRYKDFTPFLESVADNPVVNSIDIIHLLPPTVRRLLYTYPGANYGRSGYYPDCHWSSLNFRNFETLDRLADPAMATSYVLENYARVDAPYRYGDVLFLMDGNSGNAIHSCVYLADDIVFTKNGRSPMQPWVLMKLDDVVSYYGMYYTPQIACYRWKGE